MEVTAISTYLNCICLKFQLYWTGQLRSKATINLRINTSALRSSLIKDSFLVIFDQKSKIESYRLLEDFNFLQDFHLHHVYTNILLVEQSAVFKEGFKY